jgi:hypothetical protein
MVDIEGTGFAQDDLIVEIGHCLVVDRRPKSRASVYLDWTKLGVSPKWIDFRLQNVKRNIEYDRQGNRTGFRFDLTAAHLQEHGHHPAHALEFYAHFFNELRSWKCCLAGHSVLQFDFPRLKLAYKDILGVDDFIPGGDEVIDCGLIELGNGLHECLNCPKPRFFRHEPLQEFWKRLRGAAGLARWGLGYCLEKYGLLDSVVAKTQLHTALMDPYAEHLLLERQRETALK